MLKRHTKLINNPDAYTIVEVMIFLVVTAALLISALGLVSNQQAKTHFTQGVQELDAQIHATINETASGFYPNQSNFDCDVQSTGQPVLTPNNTNGTKQGQNSECTFLGKVLQFGLNDARCTTTNAVECTKYATQTVYGRRQDTDKSLVQTLWDPDGSGTGLVGAQPRLAVGAVDLSDKHDIPENLRVYDMYQVQGGHSTTIGSVGFFYPLATYNNGSSDPLSGAKDVNLLGIPGSSLGQAADPDLATSVSSIESGGAIASPDAVVICLADVGSLVRRAAIVIGGQGRQLTTDVTYNATSGVPGRGCP